MRPDVFARDGRYLMLAFDHRGSFKKLIDPENPDLVDSQRIIERKKEILLALGGLPSGILIDIEYGLYALKATALKTPYLLAMEESGYEQVGEERHTRIVHPASKLIQKGSSGAKVLLFMKGDEGAGDEQQVMTAREAFFNARTYALPFFLEIVIYGTGKKEIGGRTLVAMRHLKRVGIAPAVWKIPFPGSQAQCAEINAEAGDTPWILLSGGVPFEQFEQEVGVARKAGARGFLVGRALWQEAVGGAPEARQETLKALPERFKRLVRAME